MAQSSWCGSKLGLSAGHIMPCVHLSNGVCEGLGRDTSANGPPLVPVPWWQQFASGAGLWRPLKFVDCRLLFGDGLGSAQSCRSLHHYWVVFVSAVRSWLAALLQVLLQGAAFTGRRAPHQFSHRLLSSFLLHSCDHLPWYTASSVHV